MTSILILQHQRPDGEVDTYHLKAGRRYHLGRGSQCQIRILDLKLSRQHCAFEFKDGHWLLVDLASTNGCSLDGAVISGNAPVRVGSVVTAGTTSVTVAAIFSSDQDAPDFMAGAPVNAEPVTPLNPETGPPAASERLAAAAARSSVVADELEPHAQSSRAAISDPLIPAGPPPAQARAAATPAIQASAPTPVPADLGIDHDVLATLTPGTAPAPEAAQPSAESGSRSFYINVLGKRVGPLTRLQARELKTRELKGSLTAADLAAIEAVAASQSDSWDANPVAPAAPTPPVHAPPPAGDEQATYYITLLGKRVGPLTRSQARELKARELRGQLAEADIAHLSAR